MTGMLRAMLRTVHDLVRGGDARRTRLLTMSRPAGLFQPWGHTAIDRYPVLFAHARDLLRGTPAPRLLSFGCATGEEVATLRRYFPHATIRGLDIDPRRVAIARRRVGRGDPAIGFAVGRSLADEPAERYDAVFAMAVFRHGGLETVPPRCDHLLRFDAFEAEIGHAVRCLRPGGLLVIRHANFEVADCAAAARLTPVLTAKCRSPRYGPDHLLRPAADEQAMFRKDAG